ncbi:hypothetical protein ATO13_19495 [Stappia sp. 22II-S9-Z10]|nr:hypothetical protein ATO13_19495 [Stappia sp. 22II-S9-Z10]
MSEGHSEPQGEPQPGGISAEEHAASRRGANRTAALLLFSVMLMFFAGAFGVAFLVIYGPY